MAEDTDITLGLDVLVEALSEPRRRTRQDAAHRIALAAHQDGEQLVPYVDDLVDALYRPEAQTRWEVFDALGEITSTHPELVEGGYDGAEAALFDETSATVRLAAFRFLCRLGASSPERSDMVWQLLDESVQCYHGNPEYHDMLLALMEFSNGNLSDKTSDALVARVGFDAANGTGYTKAYSAQIIATRKEA